MRTINDPTETSFFVITHYGRLLLTSRAVSLCDVTHLDDEVGHYTMHLGVLVVQRFLKIETCKYGEIWHIYVSILMHNLQHNYNLRSFNKQFRLHNGANHILEDFLFVSL
jgi:hypothetical protein